MPHLESQTIRPLYDVHDGGPPVGYRCIFGSWTNNTFHKHDGVLGCNRVTRTLAGMRTHQRIVHGIKLQQEFQFECIEATTDQQNG